MDEPRRHSSAHRLVITSCRYGASTLWTAVGLFGVDEAASRRADPDRARVGLGENRVDEPPLERHLLAARSLPLVPALDRLLDRLARSVVVEMVDG